MFGNFSLPELLVVGALALIVIGPKDLPRMMRQVGRFVGQARGLARQFQDSMNDAAREADLEEFREARKLLKGGKSGVTDMLNETLDIDGEPKKPRAEKPKSPMLTPDEARQRAEESGFGEGRPVEARPGLADRVAQAGTDAPVPAPAPAPEPAGETPRTADAKSG